MAGYVQETGIYTFADVKYCWYAGGKYYVISGHLRIFIAVLYYLFPFNSYPFELL